jgi:uncharacterized protein
MKRFFITLLIQIGLISLFLTWGIPVYAMDIPQPNSSFYVYDEADLISTSLELEIVKTSEALAKESGAQIVVVTLDNLKGYDLEQYSVQLFREWGIGDVNKNNGVLIILAVEEREVRIEVGYGLEGAIPDSVAGRILDEAMLPNIENGDFDQAFYDTYQVIVSRVMDEYGIESLVGVETDPISSYDDIPWLWIIIGGIIILILDGFYLHGFIFNLIFRIILFSMFNGGGSGGSFNRGGGGRTGGGGASRGW